MGWAVLYGVAGVLIAAIGVVIVIFSRPITRFLQIHYGRTWGEWLARLIAIWTTVAGAVALFLFGVLMLMVALFDGVSFR